MVDQSYSSRPKTAHVKVKGNGMNIDLMLKIFKRKVKDSGILEEYKRRTEYIKPSEVKKDKKNAAVKRQRKLDHDIF
jgi:small subunit ribosomal protein S21